MRKKTKITLGIILTLIWITLSCTDSLLLAGLGVLALAAAALLLRGTEYIGG